MIMLTADQINLVIERELSTKEELLSHSMTTKFCPKYILLIKKTIADTKTIYLNIKQGHKFVDKVQRAKL